ncbi:POSSIBLE CONSERVED MEMBRANE PROTEIN [Alloactinosynnema sp. L-07]|uniref:PH domain-containing protein n=1 Tax=Alloactinosynnema sp. L-07 TaxID=1653480 RepID=UPI00065F04F4|nr:PH domain-containing protein [Alloactinosynnema sp. L-07]CRK56306.1 POSSIBLE CONSERVED MEMBRANE PROTEIN [Alloactinosynnema sp. L-07]
MIARPHRVRFVTGAIAVVFVAIFTIVAVLLRSTPTGVFFHASDQVAMAGIGVLLACGALWFTRPKVTADAEGVNVRNLLGTTYFSWDVVESVSFPNGASWARLELPDDEYVPIMALQSADGERAVAGIRELRRLLKEFRERSHEG